jgi:centrosomal protein CEP290
MLFVNQMVNTRNVIGRYDMAVVLKAQVDNLTGRNDELRRELRDVRFEASKAQENLNRANAKVNDNSIIIW